MPTANVTTAPLPSISCSAASGSSSDPDPHGLATGAKIGIGVGAGVGGLIVLAVAVFVWRYVRVRRRAATEFPVGEGGPEKGAASAHNMAPDAGHANYYQGPPQELDTFRPLGELPVPDQQHELESLESRYYAH